VRCRESTSVFIIVRKRKTGGKMLEFFIKTRSHWLNVIFIAIMIRLYWYFNKKMSEYKSTQEELERLHEELEEMNRNDTQNKIKADNYGILSGKIKAFNKILIRKNEEYHSTIEAEKYFNSINLLDEKLNMKELTSIPHMFPGLGILGTFIGLAVGLSTIKTGGTSSEILGSISPLLGSISVAFITSIFGIIFSFIASFHLNKFLGDAEKKIVEVEDLLNQIFPIYAKARQGEELLEEIKEIKNTTNNLATDISNQLGEHISTQIGDKISHLVGETNYVMKGLTENIGDKVERITEILSKDFGDSLNGAMNKIFTDELIGNFKKLGEDIVAISSENMVNMNNFKEAMESIILDLNDVKANYEDINDKTSETNTEVEESLDKLTSAITERITVVDDHLEKTLGTFNLASEHMETVEKSLSSSLEATAEVMEKLSDYMKTNKDISDSMERFINSEEKILELWNGYDEKFDGLNRLLVEGSKSFEDSLKASVISYRGQLEGIRDQFSTMMDSLNQKYCDYTNKNTLNLFEEYDKHLSTAIRRFNSLMEGIEEEVETLQGVIEAQNGKLEEAIIQLKPLEPLKSEEENRA
jgi:biopolymer transport protein ExbB/TolQ